MNDPNPIAPLCSAGRHEVVPPGSKSITCRAYILAALANGTSRIARPLRSHDTDGLLEAMATLGAAHEWDGDDVVITGVAGRFPRGGTVNLGDGGAPSRFTMAAACLAAEPVVVDGSPRMRERPVGELTTLLRALGARVDDEENPGHLPVRVYPVDADFGGSVRVSTTASSQFLTALLLIGAFVKKGIRLEFDGAVTSRSYIQLTEDILHGFGIEPKVSDSAIAVGHTPVDGCDYPIAPDASSAVYWWTAAALQPGRVVATPGLGATPRQPDWAYMHCLAQFGTSVHVGDEGFSLVCGASPITAPDGPIDLELLPDAALGLATLAAMADGPVTLIGLHTLRVKETDRIAALTTELRRIGCGIEEGEDQLIIDPTTRHDRDVVIQTYNDHRMAMSFAILGLARPGISIADPKCVGKSYPGFWADLAGLYTCD